MCNEGYNTQSNCAGLSVANASLCTLTVEVYAYLCMLQCYQLRISVSEQRLTLSPSHCSGQSVELQLHAGSHSALHAVIPTQFCSPSVSYNRTGFDMACVSNSAAAQANTFAACSIVGCCALCSVTLHMKCQASPEVSFRRQAFSTGIQASV